MKKSSAARVGAAALGALLLSAGAAMAAADEIVDDGEVEINVEVTDRYPSGVLALSVAANSTALAEVDSGDPLVREFTGSLPEVTVTDTRADVPDVPWYVLGTASDFVSGGNTITADHLGWAPYLADDYGPALEAGFDIDTVIDDPASEGLGYADGELLYVNTDQVATYSQGSWSASAGLHLKVDATTVEPGSYTSVLTLSLFE
ncbi:hypothetical protein [Agromyces silvae]|uniref:hypothetical protein n=1 Tax=Agromyces silvae TaxID=3388266 RepID=UPI00280BAFCF|nr:hypothetical protein [Agromyces protaetiae]